MSAEQNLNPQDLELLSAYLDNMLNDAERSALEAHLADDTRLRTELEALRATVALIKGLPILKAPRNFMLTPEMVKSRTEAGAPEMVKSKTESGAPSMVKSKTEAGKPQMVKSKTESGAPSMVKSKTESGRIIRFPISAVMSAAASFVFIIVGMILVVSSLNPTSRSMPATSSVALMSTATPSVLQQQNQAESTADDRTELGQTDEDVEQETSDGVNSQRAMMTPPISTTTAGMMAMPTASPAVLLEMPVESALPNMPAMPPVVADVMQTTQQANSSPAESLTQTTNDMMMFAPMPTMSQTELPVVAMSVGAGADTTPDAMTMDSAMTVVSEETMPTTGFVEVLGNALPPTPTLILTQMEWSLSTTTSALPTSTPTIIAPEQVTKIEERSSVSTDITPLVGFGLIAIGIILLIIMIWRGVRGRVS